MTAITNFGTLKTAISEISHRAESLAEVVAQAETMIASRVRALEMVTTATVAEAQRVSGGLYTLPAACLDVVAILEGATELKRRTLGELLRFLDSPPVHSYSVRGNVGGQRAEFRGIPPADSSFTVLHFAKPAAFAGDSDTNALLLARPQLYLHAALHWQHLIFQDLELSDTHRNLFLDEVDVINAEAERATNSGATPALAEFNAGGTM